MLFLKKSIILPLFLLLIFSFENVYAQKEIDWDFLADVTFTEVYNKEYEMDYKKPTFGKDVAVLGKEKEEVEITGYIFPFDLEGNYYILSKFPYNACFFCSKDGSVGPETVMELKIKERYDWFQMDDIVTFKGKLKLNDTDINQLYYILEDAEVVGQ